jgi:alkanesulfonate monooxygenase SsuD/methylene tetrahydromethanopterin reductase-like flavin-dependent oxidoreductase (luciferase family)
MLPLVYTADTDRQEMMAAILGATFGITPEQARAQMMIGTRDQCLDKVAAYVRAGVTHFIFMLMAPYLTDEIRGFAEEVAPAARRAHA